MLPYDRRSWLEANADGSTLADKGALGGYPPDDSPRGLRSLPADTGLHDGEGLKVWDSPVEGAGFEPSVPQEAARILVISVLVRADLSACRESSK